MYQDRILLTSKDILEKEFKIDTRGYRPQEVDKYLDTIIRDYEEWQKIIKEKESGRLLADISDDDDTSDGYENTVEYQKTAKSMEALGKIFNK